jgi:hypothetical protein
MLEWACSPVGIAVVWLVLHPADHLLTIAAARTFLRGGLQARVDLGGGSLEMNPVFQRAVDRGAWVSRRFLVSLLVGGLLLFGIFGLLEALDRLGEHSLWFAAEGLLGGLVVTRLLVIAAHLQNLALFRRLLTAPAAAVVRLRYDRATVFSVRRWSYLPTIALCALGSLLTRSPFFAGGLVAMVGLLTATFVWQRVDARRRAAVPAVPDRAAAPESRGSVPGE